MAKIWPYTQEVSIDIAKCNKISTLYLLDTHADQTHMNCITLRSSHYIIVNNDAWPKVKNLHMFLMNLYYLFIIYQYH